MRAEDCGHRHGLTPAEAGEGADLGGRCRGIHGDRKKQLIKNDHIHSGNKGKTKNVVVVEDGPVARCLTTSSLLLLVRHLATSSKKLLVEVRHLATHCYEMHITLICHFQVYRHDPGTPLPENHGRD